MKNDPFGNLTDWGLALDTLEDLADNGELSSCQPGLIRILRFKGHWRLREEVLKHVGKIQAPSKDLVQEVIAILDDDNIYYDARIIAGNAIIQWINKAEGACGNDIHRKTQKVIEKIKSTPQPPFFEKALERLYSELTMPTMLKNFYYVGSM